VVVLDTGVGRHPWFSPPNEPINRQLTLSSGVLVGSDVTLAESVASDPEGDGAISDSMTGTLASHAGHGTFIAGLLRQTCPEALITVLRVMGSAGVVPEDVLTTELMALAVYVGEHPHDIDVLVLSLGYYAETAADQTYTAGLLLLLAALGRRGVTTVAAAGNDSTRSRSYPAAFAVQSPFGDREVCPLISVAALNPDGTVALFSNDGHWVIAEASGANVVSTAPVTIQGGLSAVASIKDNFNGKIRSAIDPDRYSGGFATWSGTSFAAPVLAGRFLAMIADSTSPLSVEDRRKMVKKLCRPAPPL